MLHDYKLNEVAYNYTGNIDLKVTRSIINLEKTKNRIQLIKQLPKGLQRIARLFKIKVIFDKEDIIFVGKDDNCNPIIIDFNYWEQDNLSAYTLKHKDYNAYIKHENSYTYLYINKRLFEKY